MCSCFVPDLVSPEVSHNGNLPQSLPGADVKDLQALTADHVASQNPRFTWLSQVLDVHDSVNAVPRAHLYLAAEEDWILSL